MKDQRLTQSALSERSGVAMATIGEILNHDHVPKIETLFLLADALDTSRLDILLITGYLRTADSLATGRVSRPEVGEYLLQEIIEEARRIPDDLKPQALAQLRRLSRQTAGVDRDTT